MPKNIQYGGDLSSIRNALIFKNLEVDTVQDPILSNVRT